MDLEKQTKKLEKMKEAIGDATLDKNAKKKLDRDEERLKVSFLSQLLSWLLFPV